MQRLEYEAQKREFFDAFAKSAPEVRYDDNERDEEEMRDDFMQLRHFSGQQQQQQQPRVYELSKGMSTSSLMGQLRLTNADAVDDVPEEVIMEENHFQAYVEEFENAHGAHQTAETSFDDDDDYDSLFANILGDRGELDDTPLHDRMDTSHD
jgi:hypothetical protein